MKKNTFIYYKILGDLCHNYRCLLEFDKETDEEVHAWMIVDHKMSIIPCQESLIDDTVYDIAYIQSNPDKYEVIFERETTLEEIMIDIFPDIL